MAPSAIDLLKSKLKIGLAVPDATLKHQKLLDAIKEGTPGFDTPVHRQSRVDRARLAIQFMKHDEIRTAGMQVIDEAIAKVAADKAKANKEKLTPGKTAAEKTVIDNNIAALEAEKLEYIGARKEAEAAVQAAKAAAAKPTPKKPVTKPGIVGTLAGVTDAVLPKEMSEKMSKEAKALAAVVTGAALVAGLVWLFNRGKDKAKSAGKTLLIAGGVVLASIFGLKLFADLRKFGSINKMIDAKLKERQAKKEPWIKFGLTEDDYKKADDIYHEEGEAGNDKIRAFFGLAPGATNIKYEAYMEFIRGKYETVEKNGITYARAEVALQNYEDNIGTAVKELARWVKDNYVKVAVGTYIASRLGILRAILSGAGTIASKAGQLANAMRKFGWKHPIIAIFALGGAVIGIRKAISAGKDVMLPENLPMFSTAVAAKKPVSHGPLDVSLAGPLDTLSKSVEELGVITGDFATWVGTEFMDFVNYIDKKAPESFRNSDPEIIISRNMACIDALRDYLDRRKGNAPTARKKVNAGKGADYTTAIALLDAYESSFILHRCENVTTNKEPQEAYKKLEGALAKVQLLVTTEGDVVYWQPADKSEVRRALCVHPSVTDKDKLLELSKRLFHGEGDDVYVVNRVKEELGKQLGKNMDKLEGFPLGSKGFAMIIGNFLYFIEFDLSKGFIDWENMNNWARAPLSIMFSEDGKDRDWREWSADVGIGVMHTALFALSAGTLGLLKQAAIGGGPLPGRGKFKTLKKIAVNITPGVSHANVIKNTYRTYFDFKMMYHFPIRGRGFNNVFQESGLRPEWIRSIENSGNGYLARWKLRRIAKKANIRVKAARTAQQLRTTLRNGFVTRLNLSNANGQIGADGDSMYDNVRDAFAPGADAETDTVAEGLETEEDNARVETYKQMLDQGRSVTEMVKNGAHVGDLLKADADPDETLKAVQGLADEDLRAEGLDALKAAGVDTTPKPVAPKPAAKPTFTEQQIKDTVKATESGKLSLDKKTQIYSDLINKNKIPYQSLIKAGADPKALIKAGVSPAEVALHTPKPAPAKPAASKPAATKPAAKPPAPTKPIPAKPAAPKPASTAAPKITIAQLQKERGAIEKSINETVAAVRPAKGQARAKLLAKLEADFEAQAKNLESQVALDPKLDAKLAPRIAEARAMSGKMGKQLASLKSRMSKNAASQSPKGRKDKVSSRQKGTGDTSVSPGTPGAVHENRSGTDTVVDLQNPKNQVGKRKKGGGANVKVVK